MAFPIHLFCPVIKYPPSVFLAVVKRLVASLPWVGSVNPKHINFLNATQSGIILFFYSSLPHLDTTDNPRQFWTIMNVAMDTSHRASSQKIEPVSSTLSSYWCYKRDNGYRGAEAFSIESIDSCCFESVHLYSIFVKTRSLQQTWGIPYFRSLSWSKEC